MNFLISPKKISIKAWLIGFIFSLIISPQVLAVLSIAQTPLFLTQAVKPIVMLNISNDHQLYFKAFDDYSDLDGDGLPETSYKHSFDYYGYFDSYKCYTYNTTNNRFEPLSVTVNKYCTSGANEWSGNFLNWGSMARIDTIRKMLYGGFRSTDTAALTVLERTFIPTDAHSFAKFYNGADLNTLTPFSGADIANGISLCNTTVSSAGVSRSQNVTSPPLIRVAKGDFSLWASHERYQCQWKGGGNVSTGTFNTNNKNVPANSGMSAAAVFPVRASQGLGQKNYIMRVKVCVSGLIGQENCKTYGAAPSYKPIGILQEYGDNDKIRFGLMTGSYRRHISGGVLRKNVGPMTDEINVATNGTFKAILPTDSIINTLNKFRIYGYRYNDGNYFPGVGSDLCDFHVTNLSNTNEHCNNWGNPQTEIYLESLRYLAGKSATPAFNIDDSPLISGLTTATFTDPIAADEWCAPINVIQFNASTSSYDFDQLSGATDIGLADLNAATDAIGVGEGLSGNYFIGENGTDNNQLCTAKTITNLSSVKGTCPEAPRLQGTYQIAGLAHYAHTNSIRSDRTGEQLVTTYGVALSPSVPKAVVPVPGATNSITILPACRNTREAIDTNCAIVDYKIVEQDHTSNPATGKLYVNWETAEQGGDYDQDMWGILDYSVSPTHVTITTDVFAKSTGAPMAFGYVVSGTTNDGFHVHSGIKNFTHVDATIANSCVNCKVGNAATTAIYTIGASTASTLEQPLLYAAKWGGFIDSDDDGTPNILSEWDQDGDGLPDRFFFAINPAEIATALKAALDKVLTESGASASVATNSTRLDTNTVIYQAKFNSANWTGQFLSYAISTGGSIAEIPSWDAGAKLTTQGIANRHVFSYNTDISVGSVIGGVNFNHADLSVTQQALLTSHQVEYLKGATTQEQPSGILRARSGTNWLLGDIINSDPAFIGKTDLGFNTLPLVFDGTNFVQSAESSSYLDYRSGAAYLARKPMLAIGSNDGMLHIFNATIDEADSGKEILAYVPDATLGIIANYTLPSYLSSGQHNYVVDGTPTFGEAYFDADGNTVKEWRSVVVGTSGAGGAGVFALDISFIDPASAYATAEAAFTTDRVLWEINPTTAPTASDLTDVLAGPAANRRYGFTNYLGLTMGQVSIVRMANGRYAAVFGNGYNSTAGIAVLYIVDIATGELIKSITTEVGGDNGLSSPITVDLNGDRIIDAIYAGDLLGNMWKFDVSSSSTSDWEVAFSSAGSPAPLFKAEDSASTLQVISSKPQVGAHSSGGVMVYFGTGKYFETGDNIISGTPQTHTFYGIRDNSATVSRSDLQQQTIDAEGTLGSFEVRQTSENVVDYSTQSGWYMDLLNPPGTAVGERVVTHPLLRAGRIVFVTLIPASDSCSFGGTSWLMELDGLTGQRLAKTPFDLNGDGEINDLDLITIVDTDGDGDIDADDLAVGASGKKSTVGIIKTPGIIGAGDKEYKYTSGSTGTLEVTTESSLSTSGRQAWIQLR